MDENKSMEESIRRECGFGVHAQCLRRSAAQLVVESSAIRKQSNMGEMSPYAANLCPIRWGGAMSHTRLRMTILYSEDGDSKDYFGEPARQPRESPSRRRFRVSMGKTVRTKRRNEADPSDLERFVQLTTSNEILARYKRQC